MTTFFYSLLLTRIALVPRFRTQQRVVSWAVIIESQRFLRKHCLTVWLPTNRGQHQLSVSGLAAEQRMNGKAVFGVAIQQNSHERIGVLRKLQQDSHERIGVLRNGQIHYLNNEPVGSLRSTRLLGFKKRQRFWSLAKNMMDTFVFGLLECYPIR
jgi:hypothetical protein